MRLHTMRASGTSRMPWAILIRWSVMQRRWHSRSLVTGGRALPSNRRCARSVCRCYNTASASHYRISPLREPLSGNQGETVRTMPFFLRVLSRGRWIIDVRDPRVPDDLRADALGDLRSHADGLSVWHIEDDFSNLDDVIVALAAQRETLAALDYVLLDIDAVRATGGAIERSTGATKHTTANVHHRDLVELTIGHIIRLASLIGERRDDIVRRSRVEVGRLLERALDDGDIRQDDLPERIRATLRSVH